MRVPDDTSGGPNRPRKTSAVPLATPIRPSSSPRPKRKRAIGPILSTLFFCAAVALGTRLYFMLSNIGHARGGNVTPLQMVHLLDPKYDRAQFPEKNRVNVLLIGMDYSYLWTKKNPKLNGALYTSHSRADSIMMLSIDLDGNKVSALSVPRDTRITAPDGQTGKINGTFARGGAPLLMKSVTNLLGVAPDYYIAVKPNAVRDMVNALGGVTVVAKDQMEYNDSAAHLHILLPPGEQNIDGDQAVGFARFREADRYERNSDGTAVYTGQKDREGNPIFRQRHSIVHSREEGDPNRMARQQQLIRSMAAKAKSPTNWSKIPSIVDTAYGELDSNLKTEQILALMFYFRSLQPDQIQSASLEGKGTTGGTYYFLPDERKKEAMVDWLLKGDESAANRLTIVAVENGTNVPGAASRVAEKLRSEGYDAASAGTVHIAGSSVAAPVAGAEPMPGSGAKTASLPTTQITFAKASVAPRAAKIAQLLGVPPTQVTKQVKTDPADSLRQTAIDRADITVVLGSDLAASFGPRSASVLR